MNPTTALYTTQTPSGQSTRQTVSLHWQGDELCIDHTQRLPAALLRLSRGGLGNDCVFLDWQAQGIEHPTEHRLAVVDKQAAEAFLHQCPPSLRQQNQRYHQEKQLWQMKWAAVSVAVLLLLGGLLWGLFFSGLPERSLAAVVPLSWEQKLGEAAFQQVEAEGKLITSGKAFDAVQSIGQRLTKGSRYAYRWYVKNDDSINAFALPGGVVVVHTGLIKATKDAEELAGVLAHEVQHVELRHSLQGLIHAAAWGTTLALITGDPTGLATIIAFQAGSLKHSRDLERQADENGLKALVRAGIAPDGMPRFFNTLAQKESEKAGADLPAILSTHPNSQDRQADLQALLKQHPCPTCQPLALDWKAVQASLKTAVKP
jgi:Zn-dependent protease with chaperone function